MGKTSIVLVSISTLAAITILLLFLRSGENLKYSQDFVRIIPMKPLKPERIMNLSDNDYYLAGCDKEHIYLGNMKYPSEIFITNWTLKPLVGKKILIENNDKFDFNSEIQVDYPFFYIRNNSIPTIYQGKLSDWFAKEFMIKKVHFTQMVPLSRNRIAINSVLTKENENELRNVLGLVTLDTPYIQYKETLHERQADDYYGTSGILRFSKKQNRLIFVYFYHNLILQLDTTLKVTGIGHTIDSITKAKIKPLRISNDALTLASPSSIVNLNAQISGDVLFVNSNLMGNERRADFDNSSVIDLYDLNSFTYISSFYIPVHKKQKIKRFVVFNNDLVAQIGNSILSYKLDFLVNYKKYNQNIPAIQK